MDNRTESRRTGQIVLEYFVIFALIAGLSVVAISRLRGGGSFIGSLQEMFQAMTGKMADDSPQVSIGRPPRPPRCRRGDDCNPGPGPQ